MSKGYRSKDSYISKDYYKRQAQLSNLKKGRKKRPKSKKTLAEDLKKNNIIEFATKFLGLSFKERPAQEVLLRVLYGLPLNDDQLKIYSKLTKNEREFEPGIEKTEAVWVLGARSGKSLLASVIALYEGTRDKWKKYLSKGESAYIVLVATRQLQSQQIIQENCLRLLENSKYLRSFLKDQIANEITLANNVKIISLPCNSTAGRGLPIACLIFDEVAHFFSEGPKADEIIHNALRPRMAQFPGAKQILISTPSAKQGLLWSFFEEGFQVPGRFTAQASTEFCNPLIPTEFLEKEKLRDPDNYAREFDAQFCEKMESFFNYELLSECFILSGDLKYNSNFSYVLGIDASGLAGRDRFGLAVSHRVGPKIYVDYAKSFNTQDLNIIEKEIENLKSNYKVKIAVIDKFSKGFVRASLQRLGLSVTVRPSLADVYVNFKSLAIAGNLELPINNELKTGLLNTQAYYSKSNSLTIGHPRSSTGHSDLADAVVSSVYQSSRTIEQDDWNEAIPHYDGPGSFWTEPKYPQKEKFNWLHPVPIDSEE